MRGGLEQWETICVWGGERGKEGVCIGIIAKCFILTLGPWTGDNTLSLHFFDCQHEKYLS